MEGLEPLPYWFDKAISRVSFDAAPSSLRASCHEATKCENTKWCRYIGQHSTLPFFVGIFFSFSQIVPILWWKEISSPIFTDPSAVDNSNPKAIRPLKLRHINYEVHYPSKKRRTAFILLHVVECRWSNTRGFNSWPTCWSSWWSCWSSITFESLCVYTWSTIDET